MVRRHTCRSRKKLPLDFSFSFWVPDISKLVSFHVSLYFLSELVLFRKRASFPLTQSSSMVINVFADHKAQNTLLLRRHPMYKELQWTCIWGLSTICLCSNSIWSTLCWNLNLHFLESSTALLAAASVSNWTNPKPLDFQLSFSVCILQAKTLSEPMLEFKNSTSSSATAV